MFIWNWIIIFSKEFHLGLFHVLRFPIFNRKYLKNLIKITGSMMNCKTT